MSKKKAIDKAAAVAAEPEAAASEATPPEAAVIESKKKISLEPESLSLTVSESGTLTATIEGGSEDEAQILWGSSNSALANVTGFGNRGIVTGVAAGNTIVFAVIAGEGDNATAEVRVA